MPFKIKYKKTNRFDILENVYESCGEYANPKWMSVRLQRSRCFELVLRFIFLFLMRMFWFIKCCWLFWLKTQDAQLRIIVYYSHQNGLKLQKKNETYFSIITSTSFLFTPNAVIMKQVNKCIALHWKNFIKTKRNETKQQRKKTNMNYNKRMKQTWKIEYT